MKLRRLRAHLGRQTFNEQLVLRDGSYNRDFSNLLEDVAGSTEQLQQALFTLEVANVIYWGGKFLALTLQNLTI